MINQTISLSELLQSASSLNGLLSRTDSASGNGALDGMFADIVAQSGNLEQSGGASQAQGVGASTLAGSGGKAVGGDAASVSLGADASSSSEEATASSAIRSVGDATEAVRSLLAIIKRRNTGSTGSGSGERSDSSGKAAASDTPSAQRTEAGKGDFASDNVSETAGCAADAICARAVDVMADTGIAAAVDQAASGEEVQDVSQSTAEEAIISDVLVELIASLQLVQQALRQVVEATSVGGDSSLPVLTGIGTDACQVGYDLPIRDAFALVSGVTTDIEGVSDATLTDAVSLPGVEDKSSSSDKLMQEITSLLMSASSTEEIAASVDWNGKTPSFASDLNAYAAIAPQVDAGDELTALSNLIEQRAQEIRDFVDTLIGGGVSSGDVIKIAVEEVAIKVGDIALQLVKANDDMKLALQSLQEIADSEPLAFSDASSVVDTPASAAILYASSAILPSFVSSGKKLSSVKSEVKADVPVVDKSSDTADSTSSSRKTASDDKVSTAPAAYSDNASDASSRDNFSGGQSGSSNISASFDAAKGLGSVGGLQSANYGFSDALSGIQSDVDKAVVKASVVDQVALQLTRSVKNGSDKISMHLQPEGLGKVTIKLEFGADGKVQGTLTADNQQTLAMLQKDSKELERALQEVGLRADSGSLQFNLGGQERQGGAGQTASGWQNSEKSSKGSANLGSEGSVDAELSEIGAIIESGYITPSGVNIRV